MRWYKAEKVTGQHVVDGFFLGHYTVPAWRLKEHKNGDTLAEVFVRDKKKGTYSAWKAPFAMDRIVPFGSLDEAKAWARQKAPSGCSASSPRRAGTLRWYKAEKVTGQHVVDGFFLGHYTVPAWRLKEHKDGKILAEVYVRNKQKGTYSAWKEPFAMDRIVPFGSLDEAKAWARQK